MFRRTEYRYLYLQYILIKSNVSVVEQPDIAAPGVSILAAKGDSYRFSSGKCMACARVSAVEGLLMSVHPDWSPAMIKSAIVTTGRHS
jgi:subtilisin family serine protease